MYEILWFFNTHTHTHKFTNRKNHEMIIYIYNLIYINEQISHMNMQKKNKIIQLVCLFISLFVCLFIYF